LTEIDLLIKTKQIQQEDMKSNAAQNKKQNTIALRRPNQKKMTYLMFVKLLI